MKTPFQPSSSPGPEIILTTKTRIIRICLLVPIYTLSSFLSIVFYKYHVYLAGIYLFYEAYALVAF